MILLDHGCLFYTMVQLVQHVCVVGVGRAMAGDIKNILDARFTGLQRFHAADDVKRMLKDAILSQGIHANAPLPPERDLSAYFKVSRNTARKALQELVDENIIYRIQGKGTFVAGVAPVSASSRVLTIGVIFPELGIEGDIDEKNAPMHYKKLAAVEAAASERGYALASLGRKDDTRALTQYLPALPVDGVLMLASRGDRELVEEVGHCGKPMVVVAPSVISDKINMVALDQFQTGARIARYLVHAGRRRVYFGHISLDDYGIRMRMEGYQHAMREHNLPALCGALPVNSDDAISREMILDICRKSDAVIAPDDRRATALMQVAMAAGVRIPDDLAVFGYFNTDLCRTVQPKLSSVELPFNQQGRLAVELLARVIAEPRRPAEQFLVETELVIRSSSG